VPGSAPFRLDGIAPGLLAIGRVAGGREGNDGGELDRRAPFAMLTPLSPPGDGVLRLLSAADVALLPLGELAVAPEALRATLDRARDGAPDAATEADHFWRSVTWRDAHDGLRAWLGFLDARPIETSLSLETWLARHAGEALLLQPEAAEPGQLWLVIGDGVDPGGVARSLLGARYSGHGPDGQVSVLGADGVWRNWFSPSRPPRPLDKVAPGTIREVAAMRASWSPAVFGLAGLGASWISALVAVAMVRLGRGKGKS
jgi:hypothetical protein